jgi:adenosylcobyric acid synthase
VRVQFADSPAGAAAADLLVLPGTRATVADLQWLRDRGFEAVISERTRAMRPVLGICGGYQMLADFIDDDVESGAGRVDGLGVLPTHVRFGIDKQLRRPTGTAYGEVVRGYEIRHGVVTLDGRDGRAGRGEEREAEPFLADGCRVGAVWGTSWHGTLENDGFRRAFLAEVAALAASAWRPAPDTDFAALREARLDVLGDLVAEHLDTDAVTRLIADGAPPGLPVIPR